MTDLKDQIANVEQSKTLTIFMQFKPHGWARFNLDEERGALVIQSDWGDYQYFWGGGPRQWGERTFVEFLCGGHADGSPDYHYLTDKLHYGGRTRAVIDGDATRAGMHKRILEQRRRRKLTRDRARTLWEVVTLFVGNIEDEPWSDKIWLEWGQARTACDQINDFFPEVHEDILTKDAPRLAFLRDQLLPALVHHLKGMRDGNTRDHSAEPAAASGR